MKKDFQDRMDDYILDRMSQEEKRTFKEEVSQEKSKQELLDFTNKVKIAIHNRQTKLEAIKEMKKKYEDNKKHKQRYRLLGAGIAASLLIGIYFIDQSIIYNQTKTPDVIRGDKLIFNPKNTITDSIKNDTIINDSINYKIR